MQVAGAFLYHMQLVWGVLLRRELLHAYQWYMLP